jgi:hypothetical protein
MEVTMARKGLACISLVGCMLLTVACFQKPTTTPSPTPLRWSLPTHKEDRGSQAPAGTIRAALNDSQFDFDSEFLLTVSNSTEEPIEIPTPLDEDNYASTFWLYAKRRAGWQPVPRISSFIVPGIPESPSVSIPSGLEKEFDITLVVFSRAIDSKDPAPYVLGVKYLDSSGEEFFLLTDEFSIGDAAPVEEFQITVNSATADGFSITNNSEQSIWLTALCSPPQPAATWPDTGHSMLHRLSDAGSWSCVRIAADDCVQPTEMLEIIAGETKMIDGAQWLQDASVSLQPGRYRWDVVIYTKEIIQVTHQNDAKKSGVRLRESWLHQKQDLYESRHIFSEVFEYEN